MSIYERFARFYASGPYLAYSQAAVEVLPNVLEHFDLPRSGQLLDVACGEGNFAVQMARQGWQVTGIDQSAEMLALAGERARQAGVQVQFIQKDMRELSYPPDFDLVTCWYDSLNYLLSLESLNWVFTNIKEALKPGGGFIFDMNTIYGLAVGWQRQACYIQQDRQDLLEIHRSSYDYERQIASVHITGFTRRGETWERMDEIHQERAYPVVAIEASLQKVGLKVMDKFGNLKEMTPLAADSSRIFFVTCKG